MNPLAVVTGGSRGIGRAIALRLAAEGYDVIAASRTPGARTSRDDACHKAGAEAGAEAGDKTGAKAAGTIRFARLDVTDGTAVASLFASLPRCDVLVNSAGLAGANALGDNAAWHAIIAANLTGTYLCCAAAAPRLPDGRGRIVNIASVLGLRGVADQTAYCAAKHGVIGLTRALALALAPRGITVNAICPSWVATEMAVRRFEELGISEASAGAGLPIGRVVRVEEVAGAVAFLLTQGAMTGLAMPLDGGATAAI